MLGSTNSKKATVYNDNMLKLFKEMNEPMNERAIICIQVSTSKREKPMKMILK